MYETLQNIHTSRETIIVVKRIVRASIPRGWYRVIPYHPQIPPNPITIDFILAPLARKEHGGSFTNFLLDADQPVIEQCYCGTIVDQLMLTSSEWPMEHKLWRGDNWGNGMSPLKGDPGNEIATINSRYSIEGFLSNPNDSWPTTRHNSTTDCTSGLWHVFILIRYNHTHFLSQSWHQQYIVTSANGFSYRLPNFYDEQQCDGQEDPSIPLKQSITT